VAGHAGAAGGGNRSLRTLVRETGREVDGPLPDYAFINLDEVVDEVREPLPETPAVAAEENGAYLMEDLPISPRPEPSEEELSEGAAVEIDYTPSDAPAGTLFFRKTTRPA